MLPRALVLSSDAGVIAPLRQALSSASYEVRFCREIFAAIEEITRDPFQLLFVDWQQELEADFLLRTARSLKSNRQAFAIAIGTAEQRDTLDGLSDAILLKPFTAEQAVEVFLPRPSAERTSREDQTSQPAAQEPKASVVQPQSLPVENIHERVTERAPGDALPHPTQRARVTADHSASKLKRTLSLTAIVWPVVIVAALLAFDQWPELSRSRAAELARKLVAARNRTADLPNTKQFSQEGELGNEGLPPVPITDDLLSDYSPPQAPDISKESLPSQSIESGELSLIRALPSSRRLEPPVLVIEPVRTRPQVPASLGFPSGAISAYASTPDPTLPEWAHGPVTLPEAVSRLLLERQVSPEYPEQARRAGLNGPVILHAFISKDGTIRDLRLVSGYFVLAHAAFDAVKQWRYRPYRRNGQNLEVETLITIDFKGSPRG